MKNLVNGTTSVANFATGDELIGLNAASTDEIRKALSADAAALLNDPANFVETVSDAPTSEVIVKQASDLSGVLDSSVTYIIDGQIDMGSQAITVPTEGLSFKGLGYLTSAITSSDAGFTLFVDSAGDAGDLILQNLDIRVSGAGSQVFDLDNSGAGSFSALEFTQVNFTDCTSLGVLKDYRQFLITNAFVFNCDDGLEFAGTWSGGARIDLLLVRNFGAATLFKEGPSLTFGSRFFCSANMDLVAGATAYGFTSAPFGDANFELANGTYTGAGTVTALSEGDPECLFSNNRGIFNTRVGGRWSLTSETATGIGAIGTFVKAAGTTTFAGEQWFASTTNNELLYASSLPRRVEIKGAIGLSSGNAHDIDIRIRKWDESSAGYEEISTIEVTTAGNGKSENSAVLGYAEVGQDDRIELWVANKTSASNITVKLGTILAVTEI